MATSSIDRFDDAWKYVLEKMFPEFLAFYFPAVAEVIDWEAGWDFLNQELQQVHPDAELGRRAVDRLVRVRRRGGAPEMLYVHVEVQSQPDGAFGERMFTYFYRLFDRFRQPVTSLAVLADDRPGWRPDRFELHAPGTRSLLEWSTVKLLDYARHPAPGDDDNPFAWVTRAHLATLHTRGRWRQRQRAKHRLMRRAVSNGWDQVRIIGLLRALDFMMRLPPELDLPLWQDIAGVLEGGKAMVEHMFVFEEQAWEKGLRSGYEQGRAAEAALVCRLLERRFGPLPPACRERVMAGTFEELERWGMRLLDVESLEAVFQAE